MGEVPGWGALSLSGPEDWAEIPAGRHDEIRERLDSSRGLQERGQYWAAIDEYLRAILAAPGFLPAHGSLARIYLARGDLALAESKYDAIIDVCLLRGRLGDALEAHQHWLELATEESARTRLIRLLLDKATAGVGQHLFTAATYLKTGHVEEALREYREAAASFPQDALAHQWLARAFGLAGHFADAARELEMALQANPADPALLMQACAAYAAGGNQSSAHGFFQRLVSAIDSDVARLDRTLAGFSALPWPRAQIPEPGLWLGLFLLRQGHSEVARALLLHATGFKATAAAARWGLAQHYLMSSRLTETLQQLQAISGLVPGQSKSLLLLLEPYLMGEGWELATQIVHQLQRLDPDVEELYVKAAEAYFKRGRLADSLPHFARLANLCARRGNTGRAKEVQIIMAQIEARVRPRPS